jgi:hypothetical protein
MDAESSSGRLDASIEELATRQHGVVARRQLESLGLGRGAIAVRVRRRSLLRLHRGVYAVGHRKLAIQARWMAAVLASGPDAVLSHRSAGRLWGLLATSGPPETTREQSFRQRQDLRCHRGTLPLDEVEEVSGIR